MNRKQRLILSIISVVLILLIIVGITYAYFTAKIIGNTENKSVSIKTAKLKIRYNDGNGLLSADLVEPNTVLEGKTFSVINEGNMDTSYVVVIDKIKILSLDTTPPSNTTFVSNDFVYTISCTEYNDRNEKIGTCNSIDTEKKLPLVNDSILVTNKIRKNIRQEYELIITYKDTDLDQTGDMNKRLEAKVDIKNIREMNSDIVSLNPYESNNNLLSYNIINNAVNKANSTEFRANPITSPGNEISNANESELTATKDYGTSYYFRGNVVDNYLNFADMCWRIVRIEGDGSIKLLLEDQSNICQNTNGNNWRIINEANANRGSFAYTTYSAGTLVSYLGNSNTTNIYLSNFPKNNNSFKYSLTSALKKFQTDILPNKLGNNNVSLGNYLKADNWCINNKGYNLSNEEINDDVVLDRIVNQKVVYYDSYIRLFKNNKTPTLKCNGKNITKFGDDTLNMYVGALTADELLYAGASLTDNTNYYIYSGDGLDFWTISPYSFNGIYEVEVSGYKKIVASNIVNDNHSYRPSITLLSSTTITDGNGTKSNPYIIN